MSAFFSRLIAGFYYLFLGTWLGALVMLAVSAALIFRTIRTYDPQLGLAPYNDPQFAEQAAAILAGGTVGTVLGGLAVIGWICAGGVALTTALHQLFFHRQLGRLANGLRLLLLILAIASSLITSLYITPKAWELREAMYDPQRSADARAVTRETFDDYHHLSERLTGATALLLAGALLISPLALRDPLAPRAPAA